MHKTVFCLFLLVYCVSFNNGVKWDVEDQTDIEPPCQKNPIVISVYPLSDS